MGKVDKLKKINSKYVVFGDSSGYGKAMFYSVYTSFIYPFSKFTTMCRSGTMLMKPKR